MTRSGDTIRHYSLYGEFEQLPDVMHCETIASRSSLHGWELQAHRHDRLHQLLLLRSGAGEAALDESRLALQPGWLVNVPRGTVHGFRFAPGSDGLVVTWTDAMLDELLQRDPEVQRLLGRPWVAPADDGVDALALHLAQEYRGPAAARSLVLRGLGCALLARAARIGAHLDAAARQPSAPQLLQRFEALLERHFRAHWGVAEYARALAVTPTHLSRVLREATGEPASRLIDARLIREARRQLAFTNLSVTSIAYTLGYVDPALFSRVFSRVEGRSPRAFRELLEARPAP